ncbi:ankyrin repeat domain-containing protein 16-like isoform X5 [Dermacentor variabilis]|uniref:ankyrin repeat domain-containing protein 16-like isoform X5 n=1 Tax=Dermacentor variabilis TaxID=34621 RepID=UPI003F5BA777
MLYCSTDQTKRLMEHAQRDSISDMRLILSKECGDSVEQIAQYLQKITYEKSGDTLAHVASRCGSLKVLRFICKEVNCLTLLESQNHDGKRPLHEAAQSSRLDVVQFLIHQGCQIDPLKRADWTPLMLACTKNHLEVVQTLVARGANTNLRNKDGWTPFHISCREGHVRIMSCLLDMFPDAWNTSSKNKRTPLHTAGMCLCRTCCKIKQECQVKSLHGHVQCVKLLLSRGCYLPDVADNCGTTPFMDAAQADQVAIMDCLAELQKVGQHDVVKLLIGLGAICNARDNKGRTAFRVKACTAAQQTSATQTNQHTQSMLTAVDEASQATFQQHNHPSRFAWQTLS